MSALSVRPRQHQDSMSPELQNKCHPEQLLRLNSQTLAGDDKAWGIVTPGPHRKGSVRRGLGAAPVLPAWADPSPGLSPPPYPRKALAWHCSSCL